MKGLTHVWNSKRFIGSAILSRPALLMALTLAFVGQISVGHWSSECFFLPAAFNTSTSFSRNAPHRSRQSRSTKSFVRADAVARLQVDVDEVRREPRS